MLLIAGGFVLGEVLILLRILKVWQAAGVIVLFSVWYAAGLLLKSGRNKRWLLFLWISAAIGVVRGQVVLVNTEAAETAAAEAAMYSEVVITGTIDTMVETDYEVRLELRDIRLNLPNGADKQEQSGTNVRTGMGDLAAAKTQGQLQGISAACERNLLTQPLRIGMKVMVYGSIQVFPVPRNPGEFHSRNYYRGQRLNGRLRAESLTIVDSRSNLIKHGLYQLRFVCGMILRQLVPEPEAGVFQAAVLGDKADLDPDIRDLYGRSGISHLLALSGLHLSVIVSGSYQMGRRCGAGYLTMGIFGTLFAYCYVMMTGGSVSVVRAAIMLSCSFLAAWCGRTYDFLSAMGLAALLLLFSNPYRIFLSSFQLSFGAIAGIGVVLPGLCGKTDDYLKQAFSAGLAIQAVTLPIILFHFYQISLYAILLNLIVIPLMVFVIVSGLAGIGLGLIRLQLGRFAMGSGLAVLGIYEKLCLTVEKFPFSVVITGRPAGWQLVLYGVGMGLWVVFQILKAEPGNIHASKTAARKGTKKQCGFSTAALIVLQLVFLIRLPVPGVEVTFLDVGQGDGICIRSGYTTILSDAGSSDVKNLGRYRLEPFLKHQGISVLDYVYISHGDKDHISGILYLLEESRDIRIRHLMLPAAGADMPVYEQLEQLVRRRGGEVHRIGAGDIRQWGELQIACLYPEFSPAATGAASAGPATELNSHSLVLRVRYHSFQLLLTGDMGSGAEEQLLMDDSLRTQLSEVQVLKVAHHGSRYSSSGAWLAVIEPRWAVVSYGAHNSYGHPHPDVVERLDKQGVSLLRTAESGAITLSTDGKRIRFEHYLKSKKEGG